MQRNFFLVHKEIQQHLDTQVSPFLTAFFIEYVSLCKTFNVNIEKLEKDRTSVKNASTVYNGSGFHFDLDIFTSKTNLCVCYLGLWTKNIW